MSEYEMVIGLEVHVELKTRSKIFCGCEVSYGVKPNSHVCPVCMGLPGALPVLNENALFLAVKAGLALCCSINEISRFDRKHYFYPDLPKAYQISQFYEPLCTGGSLAVETEDGEKRVGITRVHIEEDAGKLTHEGDRTLLDMNRCGVGLIEIVSEPDIRSASVAGNYLRKLRSVMSYAGVSDCRMNEGSLRCDVNLSVREKGAPMGTRTEIKNLNSFQSVERAIRAEYARQCALIESGVAVIQETRRYDQRTGETYPMRTKENSDDYRYFPEPDLPPVYVTSEMLDRAKSELPVMPDERRRGFMRDYGLTCYAAGQMTVSRERADYFESCVKGSPALASTVAGLIMGEALSEYPSDEGIPIPPEDMAELADMLFRGDINSPTGKRLLALMLSSGVKPCRYAEENDMLSINDAGELLALARNTVASLPDMVSTYRAGKTKVFTALMGRCMAACGGRADAIALEAALKRALEE